MDLRKPLRHKGLVTNQESPRTRDQRGRRGWGHGGQALSGLVSQHELHEKDSDIILKEVCSGLVSSGLSKTMR